MFSKYDMQNVSLYKDSTACWSTNSDSVPSTVCLLQASASPFIYSLATVQIGSQTFIKMPIIVDYTRTA